MRDSSNRRVRRGDQMAVVERSVLVGHSAERMYSLVEHVEAYPQFLPWCSGADVSLREPGRTVATIHVNYHGVRQRFSTENLNEDGCRIIIRLLSGPFRELDGLWRFSALAADASKVEFTLRYEISNRILETLIGPVFNHIANTFVEAFVQRADQLYGAT